ncbi:MAG: hypothetical protein SFY80_14505 [Verrucomicrobiota bacterium]|nr:hypothetical protein [Verrucomicrobiota bacterium]
MHKVNDFSIDWDIFDAALLVNDIQAEVLTANCAISTKTAYLANSCAHLGENIYHAGALVAINIIWEALYFKSLRACVNGLHIDFSELITEVIR